MTTNYEQIKLNIDKEIIPKKTEIKFKSKYQKWKYDANYRKSESNKCCKTCRYCVGFCNFSCTKNYYKCNLQGISHSTATDIKLSCVCDYYREVTNDNKL